MKDFLLPSPMHRQQTPIPFLDPCALLTESTLQRERKMSLKHWLHRSFSIKRRMGTRRLAGGFAAAYWTGSALHHGVIRDISATGIYLLTMERWRPGTPIELTLHRAGLQDETTQRQITMQARAVRCGEDGVGLAFDIPSGVDPRLWVNLVENATGESTQGDIVGPFKMARALAFLSRISADSGNAVRQTIRASLSGSRLWNAIEIALQAESFLASCPDSEQLHGCPPILLRILQNGSWADEDSMRRCWAGLLARSCTVDRDDDSNRNFVDLFSQLTYTHLRIVAAACNQATKFLTESGAWHRSGLPAQPTRS